MKRIICWFRGHVALMVALPEDLFGLYVFSSIICSRCGTTLTQGVPEAEQIRHLVDLIDAARPSPLPVAFVPGDHRQWKRWPEEMRTR